MSHNQESSGSTARRALVTAGRYVWLPALVLLAIDFTVPKEHSVIRGWTTTGNYTITHDHQYNLASGDHVYFGLEGDSPEANGNAGTNGVSLGSWTGTFEGAVAGEIDATCWSAVTLNISLSQADDQLSGSGTYRVDPAACSTFGEEYEVYLSAFGERRGGRVSLRLRDADTGDLLSTFDGLIMPDRISGWFYGVDAEPASGPVTFKRSTE